MPWGFIYNENAMIAREYVGIPTHPYPVYEQLWNLAILGLIWKLRKNEQWVGALFPIYVGLYSTGRFMLTFIRHEDIILFGFQQAQLLALLGVIASAISLAVIFARKGRKLRLAAVAETPE